jgi:hypothetical protein
MQTHYYNSLAKYPVPLIYLILKDGVLSHVLGTSFTRGTRGHPNRAAGEKEGLQALSVFWIIVAALAVAFAGHYSQRIPFESPEIVHAEAR